MAPSTFMHANPSASPEITLEHGKTCSYLHFAQEERLMPLELLISSACGAMCLLKVSGHVVEQVQHSW